MAEVNKSVLVAYPAQRMFALVDAVEKYPEFLPWCGGTELIFRDAGVTRATIRINYRGIRQSFSTENTKSEPQLMQIRLIEGPFRTLEGGWRFTDLGSEGCKVELSLRYEFASRVLDKLIGPVFGYIANNLVDAFVKRAHNIYG
jgi:ribosome-associated toxin RatA of RatAB toxin-antitoxin module